jgi:hypothetical protein
MSESYRVLNQVTAAAASGSGSVGTMIYKVPNGMMAIVKSIMFLPVTALPCYITSIAVEAVNPQSSFGPITLGAGEWAEWEGSLALDSLATLRAYLAKGDTCYVTLTGMEMDVP